ncbi:MAG: glucosamine-6-phosphate deaminase [Erysipelotrichaceae bacterium]|nr:glucosamine-6-phosphate deaminase [Erysipelotrichaceae bacterium]
MFHIIIKDTYKEISEEAFKLVKEALNNENPVLGLATGSSPVGLYQEMIKDHEENGTSYKNVLTWNLDEYVGIPKTHPQSYWTFMHENLFNHIDIPEENVHVPNGEATDEEQACKDYEKSMEGHTINLQVLGIGSDGHIAFNEPGCPFDSLTHLQKLTEETRHDNARFFDGDINQVPVSAITEGLGTIMRSERIVLIATGKNKAKAVKGMIEGPKSVDCPASILQDHADVTVVLDHDAASLLTNK